MVNTPDPCDDRATHFLTGFNMSSTAPLPDHEITYRKARDLILFGELAPGEAVTIQGIVER